MFEAASIANLALNLALKFTLVAYISRRMNLPVFNFLTVPVLAWLPVDFLRLVGGPAFRLDHGFFNPSYHEWLLIENAYTLLQLGLAIPVFNLAFRWPFSLPAVSGPASPNYLRTAAGIFVTLALAMFVLTASLGFGIINWILDPRAGYQFHREGLGPFYASMVSFTVCGVFFFILSCKTRAGVVAAFVLLLPLIYLAGSKGLILRMFVAAVALYLFRFKSVPLSLIILGGIGGVGLTLANFGTADLIAIVRYFDYYSNSTLVYDALNSNRLAFFGGEVNASQIWGLVPRGLYPDKPFVYGQVILSDLLHPGIAEKGHTVAFGGPIAAYADGGLVGVFLSGVLDPSLYLFAALYGYVAREYVRRGVEDFLARPIDPIILLVLFASVDVFAYFRFPLNALLFLFIAVVILVSARLEVSRRRRPYPAAPQPA